MRGIALITYFFISLAGFTQTYEVEEVKLVATLQTINGINQKSNDFSPIALGNRIYFTSSRPYNKHHVGENNWDKSSYLNVFYGTIRNDEEGVIDVKDIRLLSNKLNTGNHTGPISFTKSGDTLFFTKVIQVSGGRERLYKAQLFSAIKKNGKWTKIKRLPFSENSSTYGHPSYDVLKNRLYFASNRPGGKGGNDIYYSQLSNGEWSEPVNVEAVNTPQNEKFPFVLGGNLFFSSDREGGVGQLDIYYSSPEPADYPIKLEGLNSPYDDFGISILPDLSAGYFSSNRTGNDDIYYFTLERKITVKNQLAGTFTFRNLTASASNLTVQLFNDEGEFIYQEKTNEDGYFLFDNIYVDSNFSVKLDGIARDEMTLEFYNGDGEPIANFLLNEEGSFKYKKLFYDQTGLIDFIPEDMKNFEQNTAHLSGKLVIENKPTEALVNATVNLVNSDKKILLTSQTDNTGNFEFNQLDLDTEYYIQIPDCTDELILYIYEASDNIYTQLKCNAQDLFVYRRLRPDIGNNLTLIEETKEDIFMLNSSEIMGVFSPINPNVPPVKCRVRIYNENGILLATTQTDSLGNFQFNNLSSEDTYKFTADSNTPLQLTLYNRYGKQIAIIQEEENNYFIFRPLGFKTDYSLDLMDDNIKFDLNSSDRYDVVTVYFNTNEAKVLANDLTKLNTLYKLLKRYPQLKLSVNAYADATASDEYNFKLSQKRGEWIVNYLIKKGIDANRFTINAYGETQLIDPENDAVNRRAELRIYQ